jgi:hypothetical protein
MSEKFKKRRHSALALHKAMLAFWCIKSFSLKNELASGETVFQNLRKRRQISYRAIIFHIQTISYFTNYWRNNRFFHLLGV